MPGFKLNVLSICIVLFLVLTSVIVWASVESNVLKGVEEMFSLRWGIATFTDFYIGATFVGVWIGVMEKSVTRGIFYTFGVYMLGNLVTLAYIAFRVRNSQNFTDIFTLR